MGSVLLEPDAVALGVPLADFGFVHGRQPVAGDMLERARTRLSGACQGIGFGAASVCLRISVIADARFSLIADGISA